MKEVLSYCGYRCDLCPAYKENLESAEDRKKVSGNWRRYYDLEVEPEEVDCLGCLQASEAPNPKCQVRPCAIGRNLRNCAECDDFICRKLRKSIDAIKPIAEKHEGTMPAEDYQKYIYPYESEALLRKLRGEP